MFHHSISTTHSCSTTFFSQPSLHSIPKSPLTHCFLLSLPRSRKQSHRVYFDLFPKEFFVFNCPKGVWTTMPYERARRITLDASKVTSRILFVIERSYRDSFPAACQTVFGLEEDRFRKFRDKFESFQNAHVVGCSKKKLKFVFYFYLHRPTQFLSAGSLTAFRCIQRAQRSAVPRCSNPCDECGNGVVGCKVRQGVEGVAELQT
ncbi:hypothetical protein L596_009858 [Steinernema carpocapsae]|uniref:Uncharacterized protein n=1 Tax=Steinernema carpocapsae TaxID=34508 RepID=A0A4U5PGW1_STECR|nr:hypothetical protein L596_009858 [Steinernema carpocapsae]